MKNKFQCHFFCASSAQASDPDGCKNPASEDPESWDCECAENMKEECAKRGEVGPLLEACFCQLMCELCLQGSHGPSGGVENLSVSAQSENEYTH